MTPRRRYTFLALTITLAVAVVVATRHEEHRRTPHSRNASPVFGQVIPIPVDFEGASLARSVELINEQFAKLNPKEPLRIVLVKDTDPLPDGFHRVMLDFPLLAAPPSPGGSTAPSPPKPRIRDLFLPYPLEETKTARGLFAKQPFRKAFQTFLGTFQGPYSCLYVGNTAYVYDLNDIRPERQTRTLYLIDTGTTLSNETGKTSAPIVDLTKLAGECSPLIPGDAHVEYHRKDATLVIQTDEDAADIIEDRLTRNPDDLIAFTAIGYSGPPTVESASERRHIRFNEWSYRQRLGWWEHECKIRKALGFSYSIPPIPWEFYSSP